MYPRIVPAALALWASLAMADQGPPVLRQPEDLTVAVDAALLKKQFDALAAMPSVQVAYSIRGPVVSIFGETGVVLPASVRELKQGDSARIILDTFRDVLLATGSETFTVTQNWLIDSNRRALHAEESILGRPVVNGRLMLEIDESTGQVRRLETNFLPDRDLPRDARMSAERASQLVTQALEVSTDAKPGTAQGQGTPALAYFGSWPKSERGQLVWTVPMHYECPTGIQQDEAVFIDAIDGTIVHHEPVRRVRTFAPSPPCHPREPQDCVSEPHALQPAAPQELQATKAPSKPAITVTRIACSNSYRVNWPRIPGATTYAVQRAPASVGWAFARTVADGYVHQCTIKVDGATMFRMMACNGCGCSDWTVPVVADPTRACR
jgi:hypothetical protein